MGRDRPGYQEDYRRQRPNVGTRVDRDTHAKLELLAAAEGKSVGVYMRDHIESLVASAGNPEKDKMTT